MTKKSKPSLNILEKYGFHRQSPGSYYNNKMNLHISSVPAGYEIIKWNDTDDNEDVIIVETIREVKDYLKIK
jgi:predicted RNA methylase